MSAKLPPSSLAIVLQLIIAYPLYAQPPGLAKPGQSGYVSSELIYAIQAAPTPECHASTIAETPAGHVDHLG